MKHSHLKNKNSRSRSVSISETLKRCFRDAVFSISKLLLLITKWYSLVPAINICKVTNNNLLTISCSSKNVEAHVSSHTAPVLMHEGRLWHVAGSFCIAFCSSLQVCCNCWKLHLHERQPTIYITGKLSRRLRSLNELHVLASVKSRTVLPMTHSAQV